jgi:hypothetical protein
MYALATAAEAQDRRDWKSLAQFGAVGGGGGRHLMIQDGHFMIQVTQALIPVGTP